MITFVKNFFKRRMFKGAPSPNDAAWASLIVEHVNMHIEKDEELSRVEDLARACQAEIQKLRDMVITLDLGTESELREIRDSVAFLRRAVSAQSQKRKTTKRRKR